MKWLAAIVAWLARLWPELNGSARARRRWESRLKELEDAYQQAKAAHALAVAMGEEAAIAGLYRDWLQASIELNAHRRAGQRQGFLDRAE
jgi:hypothetical protein